MLATYWKMFLVTVPRDPSMNMPMLIRMQWKRFCSTLTKNYFTILLQNYPHLWKSPGPTNESYQASLNVVVDNGGGGPVLQQEHQVAVVEVVSLVRFLSVLLMICLYKKSINSNRNKVMHLDDNTASLSYKDSTVPQLKGSVVTSLL